MVQWQSDLRVSWRAQWMSLLLHGIAAAIILLAPWPPDMMAVWLILLSLVVFDCVRSQRRINSRQGEICLLQDGGLKWQGQTWQLIGKPLVLSYGVLLRAKGDSHREMIWLAADSMDKNAWRDLRRVLKQRSPAAN